MSDLSALTLLNTRPAHQADSLSKLVRQYHGQVLVCPTIEIQWRSPEEVGIQSLSKVDKIIFISVNAIKGFLAHSCYLQYLNTLECRNSPIEWYAIGQATQQYGMSQRLPLRLLSQEAFDSESLLAHPLMHTVKQQSILIVKGTGGRAILAETLSLRGAKVQCLEVYSRIPAPFCSLNWKTFTKAPVPVLLISSVESFQNLLRNLSQFDLDYASLNHSKWSFLEATVVFSQRIKSFLLDQGWSRPIWVVASQSNQGIVETLKQINLGKKHVKKSCKQDRC